MWSIRAGASHELGNWCTGARELRGGHTSVILTMFTVWFPDWRDRPRAIDRHIDYFGGARVPASARPILSVPDRTESRTRTLVSASAEGHTASMCDEAEAIG
jgi:hypothetical protein